MKEPEFTSSAHQEIQDLLPWYVNQTLTNVEREAMDAHLSQCSVCQAELETLKDLSSVVTTSNERLSYPSESQIESLAAQVGDFESRRARPTIGARVRDWWMSLPAFSRWAIAAQAVALIVLAGTSIVLLRRAHNLEAAARAERQRADLNESLLAQEKQRAIEYQGLSGPENGEPGIRITVVFREDATEKAIRELLLGIDGARIISGPSSARFYVLGIATPPGADPQQLMNDAIARLRRSNVVQLAEPIF
jgi:anti-sigma factor RsiW